VPDPWFDGMPLPNDARLNGREPSCACDELCYGFGDCCFDFAQACPSFIPAPDSSITRSCAGRCGQNRDGSSDSYGSSPSTASQASALPPNAGSSTSTTTQPKASDAMDAMRFGTKEELEKYFSDPANFANLNDAPLRRQFAPPSSATEQRNRLGPGSAGGLFEAGWGYGGYSKQAQMQALLGTGSPFQPCYCDWNCPVYEDCCPDFQLVCR
jgi:hypothetical protein